MQMLLEPLKQLKQADARLNMTQGVLEGVGMSTTHLLLSALVSERIVGILFKSFCEVRLLEKS